MCFIGFKLIRKNLFSLSERVLKRTYSNVEIKIFSWGNTLDPRFRGGGRERGMKEGQHKVKVNILLYSDPYHWTRSAVHCWQLVGKSNVCSIYGAFGSPAYYSLAPQVHERT